jgi:hypothetical protein
VAQVVDFLLKLNRQGKKLVMKIYPCSLQKKEARAQDNPVNRQLRIIVSK